MKIVNMLARMNFNPTSGRHITTDDETGLYEFMILVILGKKIQNIHESKNQDDNIFLHLYFIS